MDGTKILQLLLLGAVVSAVTAACKMAIGEGSFKRFLPLFPLILGAIGGALVPSLTPGSDAGTRIVWGVLAGAFSGQLYEVVRRQFEGATQKQ